MTLNYLPPYCPWYNPAEYAFSTSSVSFGQGVSPEDLGDVKYAVTQLPCMEQSFVAKCLWAKDKEIVDHLKTPKGCDP
jgi:hypothetical protein